MTGVQTCALPISRLEREIQTLVTRTLKRETEEISDTAKCKIKSSITDFFGDAEDILMRYIPEFDSRDFIKGFEGQINLDIEDASVFDYEGSDEDNYGLGDFLFDFLNGASYGVISSIGNFISHNDTQRDLHNYVNKIRNCDVTEYLDSIFNRKNELINKIRTHFIEELIEPLQEKVNEILVNKANREKELQEANSKLDKLIKEKTILDAQLKEVH